MSAKKPESLTPQAAPMPENGKRLEQASRRKLLKKASLIGIPAVATLASRPVLAWHCRTPSMWGSMVMNPSTSLRSNEGHQTGYKDETWAITNWGRNTGRSVIFGGLAPWNHLLVNGIDLKIYTYAIETIQPPSHFLVLEKNAAGTPTKYLNFNLFKISDLCAATSISMPNDVASTATVATLLDQNFLSFGAHLVVAQLNYKYLRNIAGTAYLDDCIGGGRMNLSDVARTGTYTPSNGGAWSQGRIISYLQNNWIVVPYEGYVSWYTTSEPTVGYNTGVNTDGQEYNYFSFPNKINTK